MNLTINTTLPCESFSSLTDLVVAANHAQINITLEVQKCPGICLLAWGTGNPDLSGVGTNISWIFQAILTVLLCPLLRVWLDMASSKKVKGSGRVKELLQDTHKEFLGATILIAVSVLVATIVYIKHTHALFEVTFLYYLATMQFLALLGTAISTLQFWDERPSKSDDRPSNIGPSASGPMKTQFWKDQLYLVEQNRKKWKEETVITTVACLIGFGLYLGSLSWIRGQSISLSLLPELASSCTKYGKIVPHIPPATSPAPKINWGLLHHMWTHIKAPSNFFVCVLFVLIIICAVIAVVALAVAVFWALLGILADPYTNSLLTLGFAIGVLFCTGQMQAKRNDLKKLAGEKYTDGEWGFGQVVAVFVWIPTTLRLIARWVEIYPACRKATPLDDVEQTAGQEIEPEAPLRKGRRKKVEEESKGIMQANSQEIPEETSPAAPQENELGAEQEDKQEKPEQESKEAMQTDSQEISDESPTAAPKQNEPGDQQGDQQGEPGEKSKGVMQANSQEVSEEMPLAAPQENEPGAKQGDQQEKPEQESKEAMQTDSQEISEEMPPAAAQESLEDKPLENPQEEIPQEAPQEDSEKSQEAKTDKRPDES